MVWNLLKKFTQNLNLYTVMMRRTRRLTYEMSCISNGPSIFVCFRSSWEHIKTLSGENKRKTFKDEELKSKHFLKWANQLSLFVHVLLSILLLFQLPYTSYFFPSFFTLSSSHRLSGGFLICQVICTSENHISLKKKEKKEIASSFEFFSRMQNKILFR